MTKRFFATLLIVLAVLIFLGAAFFLVLFLAPGFSVFGLKYIAADTRAVAVNKMSLTEYIVNRDANDEYTSTSQVYNSVTGIKVESTEIAVNFILSQGWDFEVEYYDNYNGFTTTNIEYPSITVGFANNIISIKTSEFEKIIGEMANSKRYLNIYLPLKDVGSTRVNEIDLEVNSKRSNINFTKEQGNADARYAQFKTLKISTGGTLGTDSPMTANNFVWKTSRKIDISDSGNFITAQSYELESTGSSITVSAPVVGDLKATTDYGNISFQRVGGSLYATTEHGNIIGNGDSTVSGLVFLSTKSGSVNIKTIVGPNGNSTIETHSGNVNIDTLENAEITTTRGEVNIRSLNSAKITTNMGKVTVEEVKADVDINTKRGNVYVGGTDMVVNNPKIFSRLGKVFVYSASGETTIETISGNVDFTNTDSTAININCGGKLTTANLTGAVTIVAEKDATLGFGLITDDVNITLGDDCKDLSMFCTETLMNEVRYSLEGRYVEVYTQNDTGGYSRVKEGETQYNQDNADAPLVKVTGKNALIKVYFK